MNITLLLLSLATLISIFSGFYFGYKLSQGVDPLKELLNKAPKRIKPIKNSVRLLTDEERNKLEDRLEAEQEDKENREHYGL